MKQVNRFIDPDIYSGISVNTRVISFVNECLPIDFSAHIECSGICGKNLNLVTDSAARSSQLRFYTDAILTALHRNGFTQLTTIKISTSVALHPSTRAARIAGKATAISAQTCELIESTARTIEDEKLRRALQKLAEIGGKKT